MPSLKAAHIREQGQDMIIFPLDSAFGRKSHGDQTATLSALQVRAHAAGLAGKAVAVWQSGNTTHFMGPKPWHGFLSGISMQWVWANVNKEISWND
ncbi:MAG TPA: hypothetical protein VH331_09260 [Allosphingosinicella sp.]|jgi:hypothetical protein|nr:hypothetical protein [Allosphingosinicella sp.]